MSREEVVKGPGLAGTSPDAAAPRPTRKPRAKKDPATGIAAGPARPPAAPAIATVARPGAVDDDDRLARDLRPRRFAEYIGQRIVVDPLSIAVKAAQQRGDPLDHVLFHGPPGLGKTTLAHIIAREMQANLTHTSGPALERPADVVGLVSNLKKGDVLFIDEIHRLSRAVEEYLYSAMEDFRVDFVTGSGAFAKTISLPLERFTMIGSTTRAGMLSAPLRERFGLTYHLEYYTPEELTQVVTRSAGILSINIAPDAAAEIARRSRGTPRIANRLLRRVRDFAEVTMPGHEASSRTANSAPGGPAPVRPEPGIARPGAPVGPGPVEGRKTPPGQAGPLVTLNIAAQALRLEGVDELGLDRLDRMYLQTLGVNYQGGPAGVEALAASLNEEQQTLVDVVEPFLLKIGYIIRTPGGRKCTPSGMQHVGASPGRSGSRGAPEQPRLV